MPEPTSPVSALTGLSDLETPLLIAVSGGSDSMALLYAAVAARDGLPRFPELHAITIDHALRPESAGEARFVADMCGRLGVSHRTHRLDWTAPESGMQSKARRARLTALRATALDVGATILTGHTADDDAETVAMRLEREASPDEAEWTGIPAGLWLQPGWLLRPLLRRSRMALREWLLSVGGQWIDDPSNEDERFERVRMRRELAGDPGATERLVEHAIRAGEKRSDLASSAAQSLAVEFRASCEGFGARIAKPEKFDQHDRAAMLAFRTTCAHVGGLTRLPTADEAREAFAQLRKAGPSGPARSATIARCLITYHVDALHIVPEQRAPGAPRVAGYAVSFGERNGEWRTPRRVATSRWDVPLFHGVWTPDGLSPGDAVWAPNPAIYSTNPNGTATPVAAIARETPSHGMVHAHRGGGCEREVTTRPLVRALTPYVEFVPAVDLPIARALAGFAGRSPVEVPRHLPLDADRTPFAPR